MKSTHAFLLPLVLAFSLYPFSAGADDGWPAILDTDLRVQAGSALDLGVHFKRDPVSERLTVVGGKLMRGSDRQRFLCAPLVLGPLGGFPDRAGADALAAELRVRGYNLVRIPHIDSILKDGRTLPHDYDPATVDRFHYLLAALKREGLRWTIDAATSKDSVYNGLELNLTVHYNAASQAYWREQVNKMLNVRNPYTGLNILEDPALVSVTLFNELSLGYAVDGKTYPQEIADRFLPWVLALNPKKTSTRIPGRYENSPRAAQMQQFLGIMEAETATWMTAHLRSLGYKGIVTAYNNGKNIQTTYGRSIMPLVSIHAHYDNTTDFIEPGSTQTQLSAVENALPHPRYFMLNRYLDRPFIVDEYSHPYWSIWRREAGLAMPAYAAFQDWDGICRFSNPVTLSYDGSGTHRERYMTPFSVGMDPIARAGETLAALLFRRGDVSVAKTQVPVYVDESFLFSESSGTAPMPAGYAKAGLVTGIGLLKTGTARTAPMSFAPTPAEAENRDDAAQNLIWEQKLAAMRTAGVIKKANKTNVAAQIYETDTNQIKINAAVRQMKVESSRTAAAVFDQAPLPQLEYLQFEAADTPALVALSAIDSKTLARSQRMLLIVATDAANTGAQFSADRTVLLENGELPIRLKPIKLRFFYKRTTDPTMRYSLYALHLNGARGQQLPLDVFPTGLRVNIDTAALTGGPTTYFELIEENN